MDFLDGVEYLDNDLGEIGLEDVELGGLGDVHVFLEEGVALSELGQLPVVFLGGRGRRGLLAHLLTYNYHPNSINQL